ncbi:MAG: 4Fe-4S dicluster domain-containing protein [Armatimonadota bacterium]|nr:4Fe-4S dicluster domain-containing protein [Armatimonadota bacterium]MDR5703584.1 4Fe-4S dicluster domain-containing protein [Armatimonadota bacterium]
MDQRRHRAGGSVRSITRREFVRKGLGGLILLTAGGVLSSRAVAKAPLVREKAILIDTARCIGCKSCVAACKEAHGLPPEETGDLSPTTLTNVFFRTIAEPKPHLVLGEARLQERSYKYQCMHCLDPACASACPVAALRKTPQGPVIYDASRCIGCRYCMMACPFRVPRFEWGKALPSITKCDFCAGRLAAGKKPACVEACPAEALKFGDREELLREARERIKGDPARYFNYIYGEHEVGGTSMLYLADVPFQELGFPNLPKEPLPALTWKSLSKIPGLVVLLGAFLSFVQWLSQRRVEVERIEVAVERRKAA